MSAIEGRQDILGRWAEVYRRSPLGFILKDKPMRMFWGGRRQSKYNPVAEDAKRGRRQ